MHIHTDESQAGIHVVCVQNDTSHLTSVSVIMFQCPFAQTHTSGSFATARCSGHSAPGLEALPATRCPQGPSIPGSTASPGSGMLGASRRFMASLCTGSTAKCPLGPFRGAPLLLVDGLRQLQWGPAPCKFETGVSVGMDAVAEGRYLNLGGFRTRYEVPLLARLTAGARERPAHQRSITNRKQEASARSPFPSPATSPSSPCHAALAKHHHQSSAPSRPSSCCMRSQHFQHPQYC